MHGLFVRDLQTPAQSKFRGVSVDQRAEAVRPALRGRVLQDMQCMIVISDLGGPYRVVSGHHPILPVIGDDARPGDVNDVPRVVDSQVGDARILARPMADATPFRDVLSRAVEVLDSAIGCSEVFLCDVKSGL